MPVAVRLAALPMLLEHGAWAHSVVLRTRACVRAGKVRTAHTPCPRSPTRSVGAHMRALARRGCWDRVTLTRSRRSSIV